MNAMNKLVLILLAMGLALAHSTTAVTTIVYVDAQGSNGSISGQSTDPNISDVQLSRGPGLISDATLSAYYDSANWSTSLTFPGTESGSYVAFQFEVASGYVFDPTSFSFYYEDGGNNRGPLFIDLRSNSDTYANSLYLDENARDATVESVGDLDLAPVSGLVEYRFYGYWAANESGILGFTNNPAIDFQGSGVSLLMEGDLQPIPEVSQSAVICAIVSFLLIGCRRLRLPV